MSEIVAIGGSAFSGEPQNLALDQYILKQTGKSRPRVLLIPTARGDDADYVAKFYAAYAALDARPAHLPFFQRTPDLRELVLAQDAIFVGGGNTRSMLAVWRGWGLMELLEEASAAGVFLAGVSAGAICWFEQGVTDSWADRLRPLECMGWLPGSCCPHYDGEAERRPAYHSLLLAGQLKPGYAIEDGVAAHFTNGKLTRIVSKNAGSRAYYVSVVDGKVREHALDPLLLSPLP
jgi:dipeptidase E